MGDKEARISLSGSPHRSHHAPGTSTPFPMTPVKFEYPEEIPGGKHQQPSSPFRASATASERHEFAQTLQRALRNLKPKPFTLNVKFKTPPSIVASRRRASARVPSPTISSSGTISTINSTESSRHGNGFFEVNGNDRYSLKSNGSIATISNASDRY